MVGGRRRIAGRFGSAAGRGSDVMIIAGTVGMLLLILLLVLLLLWATGAIDDGGAGRNEAIEAMERGVGRR